MSDAMERLVRIRQLMDARTFLRAQPSDIPGLWEAPGYPELTTNQMLQIWREQNGYTAPFAVGNR